MIELSIQLSADEFPDLSPGQISRLTRSVASRVRAAVIKATPKGDRPLDYRQERRTRESWTAVKKDVGGYSFENPLIQTESLEHGSKRGHLPWPSVPEKKPRTVYSQGRVYSSQAPKGITAKAKVDEIANKIAKELFVLLVKGKSIAAR